MGKHREQVPQLGDDEAEVQVRDQEGDVFEPPVNLLHLPLEGEAAFALLGS